MHPIHPVLWYYCHSKSYLCIFYHFLQTQSYRNSCMNPTCFGMRRVQNIREYFFHIRNHLQPKFNNSTLFKEGNIDLLNRDINKKKNTYQYNHCRTVQSRSCMSRSMIQLCFCKRCRFCCTCRFPLHIR